MVKSKTREYRSWGAMKQRCYNQNNTKYHNYGGRGIKVCERWLNSFDNFLEDMGKRPEGMSLDRIDNDKGYSPENCRWATNRQQNQNSRPFLDKGDMHQIVEYMARGKRYWRVQIMRNRTTIIANLYSDLTEAKRVRDEVNRRFDIDPDMKPIKLRKEKI